MSQSQEMVPKNVAVSHPQEIAPTVGVLAPSTEEKYPVQSSSLPEPDSLASVFSFTERLKLGKFEYAQWEIEAYLAPKYDLGRIPLTPPCDELDVYLQELKPQ
jgi:hypothetical protein